MKKQSVAHMRSYLGGIALISAHLNAGAHALAELRLLSRSTRPLLHQIDSPIQLHPTIRLL